jgi:hypothetical protein
MNGIKEKLDASKSRNRVLINESKTLKEQVKTLLEKGQHDDELVEALLVSKLSYYLMLSISGHWFIRAIQHRCICLYVLSIHIDT